mmetsp:Transcript_8242/g.17518  ORF Transcript_8242/g.17518 Transcript_8242/m.17518 type:complete len:88 (+) Transcript_8242:21-284(+)
MLQFMIFGVERSNSIKVFGGWKSDLHIMSHRLSNRRVRVRMERSSRGQLQNQLQPQWHLFRLFGTLKINETHISHAVHYVRWGFAGT